MQSTIFPLNGVQLEFNTSQVFVEMRPFFQSLLYQAAGLGINITPNEGHNTDHCGFILREGENHTCVNLSGMQLKSGKALPYTEFITQALTGLMSINGRAAGSLQILNLPYLSTVSATIALQGALAALFAQRVTSSDKTVFSSFSTSMESCGLTAISQYLAGATSINHAERILPDTFADCFQPPFESKDGIVFEIETLSAEPWIQFWQQFQIPNQLIGKGWQAFLMRYAKAASPIPHELAQALKNEPYERIRLLCQLAGVSICPIQSDNNANSITEQFATDWPWAFTGSLLGTKTVTTPSQEKCIPEDTLQVLPLSGIRVIESCRRIQGPLAGHLLALLGAKVIRIEQPGGDPLRGMQPEANGVSVRFDALNHLKDVVEIDIKTDVGKEKVLELAEKADVFLHNWAPGKAKELRLDAEHLTQVNPSLIYSYAGGFPNSEISHDADENITQKLNHNTELPGTDFMVQAYSGIADKIGKQGNKKAGSLFTVLDVLGGVVSSQGIITALLSNCIASAQAKSSTIQPTLRVDTSLLGAANLLNIPKGKLKDIDALLPAPVSTHTAFQHILTAHSGSIAIDSTIPKIENVLNNIAESLNISISAFETQGANNSNNHGLILSAIKEILIQKPASEWVQIFQEKDIAAVEVVEDLAQLTKLNNPIITKNSQHAGYVRVNSPWAFHTGDE